MDPGWGGGAGGQSPFLQGAVLWAPDLSPRSEREPRRVVEGTGGQRVLFSDSMGQALGVRTPQARGPRGLREPWREAHMALPHSLQGAGLGRRVLLAWPRHKVRAGVLSSRAGHGPVTGTGDLHTSSECGHPLALSPNGFQASMTDTSRHLSTCSRAWQRN